MAWLKPVHGSSRLEARTANDAVAKRITGILIGTHQCTDRVATRGVGVFVYRTVTN